MYLARYDFTGDPAALHAGITRALDAAPADEILLNVAVRTETGVSMYDACPDEATFLEFTRGGQLAKIVADAGLPAPTVTPLGEVVATVVNASAVPA